MKRPLTVLALRLRLVALTLFLSGVSIGFAAGSSLSFTPLAAQPLGDRVSITVQLRSDSARAIPNSTLMLSLDGQPLQRAHTNSAGIATVILSELPAGQYRLTARFAGNRTYRASEATLNFTVKPAVLEVKAVPAMTGLRFKLGERTFSTGSDGVARITIERSGSYRLEALPWQDDAMGVRIVFNRWQDQIFTPYREVMIPQVQRLEAGFELNYLVDFAFVERRGVSVPAQRLSSMMFKSSHGRTHVVSGQEAVWLQANRILRRTWGLESRALRYTLETVIIDTSNVVNRGQQRFSALPNGTWKIETLLYYAHFRAIDAVFGFAIGEGITLEYPDGRIETLSFGPDGDLEVGPLARGLYKAEVIGASGMASVTPVALSRDQQVELKVLSSLDIGVGFSLGMILALSLLFYGRPQLLWLILGFIFWPFLRGRRRRIALQNSPLSPVYAKVARGASPAERGTMGGAKS